MPDGALPSLTMFWMKKLIAAGLMPFTLGVVALVVALVMLSAERWRRRGKWLAWVAVMSLAVLGNHYVARGLMRPLETRYSAVPESNQPPSQIAACAFIVVLGAGGGTTDEAAALNQLNFSGLSRITEGVRLARLLPEARIVVSGPLLPGGVTHASQLKRAAISLGLTADRIVTIEDALDTENEARLAAAIVGDKPVALVTSAAHMPRALGLFRGAGIKAVPCPTGYRTQEKEAFVVEHVLFDADSLSISTNAVRERIGMLWNWVRGRSS
jgi:uncharacterized SAM-binding protein YcdF (DUF218 family)